MTEYGRYSVNRILDLCGPSAEAFCHTMPDGNHIIVPRKQMRDLRLQCFKKSVYCVDCGLRGRIFILEQCVGPGNYPHFNLYGYRNGDRRHLVLMTQDHRWARSLGGPHKLSNLQTMCLTCNNRKGKSENKLARKRRELNEDQLLTDISHGLLGISGQL